MALEFQRTMSPTLCFLIVSADLLKDAIIENYSQPKSIADYKLTRQPFSILLFVIIIDDDSIITILLSLSSSDPSILLNTLWCHQNRHYLLSSSKVKFDSDSKIDDNDNEIMNPISTTENPPQRTLSVYNYRCLF